MLTSYPVKDEFSARNLPLASSVLAFFDSELTELALRLRGQTLAVFVRGRDVELK
jgi:hypothetical protein